jgi:hypothetical protein
MAGPWGRTRDGGVISMVLTFRVHPGHYAIAVLRADEPVPGWPGGDFMAIVRTAAELTIVSDETRVPPDVNQPDRALPVPFADIAVEVPVAMDDSLTQPR